MTYVIDHRVRVVVNYLQSQSLRKTAQLYNCSKSSVSNWSRLIKTSYYLKKDDVETLPREKYNT